MKNKGLSIIAKLISDEIYKYKIEIKGLFVFEIPINYILKTDKSFFDGDFTNITIDKKWFEENNICI